MQRECYHLNVSDSLAELLKSKRSLTSAPRDPQSWRAVVSPVVDWQRYEELYGGHRNLVVKEHHGSGLIIYWRDSDRHWDQILRALLLEDCLARKFQLPGRVLADPNRPVEITEQGFYISRMQFVEAEYRYPWNLAEIASAARLLGQLHAKLRQIAFEPQAALPVLRDQWLHLDFARGNVLFEKNSSEAKAVIDYETVALGSREQDLGRTASLLLVDTNLPDQRALSLHQTHLLSAVFAERLHAWLGNYPSPFDEKLTLLWAASYLVAQDYGSLNPVRDLAITWLKQTYDLSH